MAKKEKSGSSKSSGGKSGSSDGKSSWSNKIIEDLFEQRGINVDIKKDTNLGKLLQQDRSQPHKLRFDSKNTITLLCPPEKLLENINNVLIQRQVSGLFLGDYDFEEWFEDFTWEFRKDLPSTKQLPPGEINPWGRDSKNRPKKLNLLSLDEVAKLGKQKILFYPDRTVEQNILFTGTYHELRQQLLDYMRSPVESCVSSRGISERKYLSGHPKIKLLFRQVSELQNDQAAGLKSEISLTLNEYSEYDDGYGFKTLSIQDLRQFAQKIKNLFVEPELFKIERGKEGYSYQDWKRGYGTWSNFLNKESAVSFFKRYVQIKGDQFRPEKIGENPNTDKADDKEEVEILGEQTALPQRFRKVSLALWVAYCDMPVSGQKIVLVTRSQRQPVDSRILG
ncbi:MAG: hypothetical protein F6K54_16180 [Okeania sp. SIO3B5]|uniref:hypothetical protein n=1 Tax=Okeania sp. SIO3B5 TaxID=2607811 RepID=UPI001400D841|nr:hypothetical protein [Okeania sp. SIO3B5]NEO54482.1 hypothetical protein [Okeania sp. SIO3B5]